MCIVFIEKAFMCIVFIEKAFIMKIIFLTQNCCRWDVRLSAMFK